MKPTKKSRLFTAALLLALCTVFSFANDPPNVAVCILGNPPNHTILKVAFNDALVNSGKYNVIAVDAIEAIMKEHMRQMDGTVRSSEIAQLGEDAGAAYMLVVERADDGMNTYYISARMVSVERKIAILSKLSEKLSPGSDVAGVVGAQVAALLNLQPPPPKFTTPGDGNTYRTVTIDGQVWMAENLNLKAGKSWCYGDDENNCRKYGRLYDWHTAKTACPSGWRLPIRREWDMMARSIGGEEDAGRKLKSKSKWNGTDEYEWGALPGGARHPDGGFHSAGDVGTWWSASESTGEKAYGRYINAGRGSMYENNSKKETGYSVRCVAE